MAFLVWLVGLLSAAAGTGQGWQESFDAGALGARWQWRTPVAGPTLSLTDRPGWLRISVPQREQGFNHWSDPAVDEAPQLRTVAPQGDWILETHLQLRQFDTYSHFHTGLVIGTSDAHLVAWGPLQGHAIPGGPATPEARLEPTGHSGYARVPGEARDLALRLTRAGNVVRASLRSGEGEWVEGGTYTLAQPPRFVGLITKTFAPTPGVVVDVDYLRLNPIASPTTPPRLGPAAAIARTVAPVRAAAPKPPASPAGRFTSVAGAATKLGATGPAGIAEPRSITAASRPAAAAAAPAGPPLALAEETDAAEYNVVFHLTSRTPLRLALARQPDGSGYVLDLGAKLTALLRVEGGRETRLASVQGSCLGAKPLLVTVKRRPGVLCVERDRRLILRAYDDRFAAGESGFITAPAEGAVESFRLQPVGEIEYGDDFLPDSATARDWEAASGTWGIGSYRDPMMGEDQGPVGASWYAAKGSGPCLAVGGYNWWSDLAAEVTARAEKGNTAGIAFNYRDGRNYCLFRVAVGRPGGPARRSSRRSSTASTARSPARPGAAPSPGGTACAWRRTAPTHAHSSTAPLSPREASPCRATAASASSRTAAPRRSSTTSRSARSACCTTIC